MTMTTTSAVNMTSASRVDLGDINLRVKEIPSVRVHMPMNYQLGFSVLGMEILSLSLCGESMVITEPYRPNECEICRPARVEIQGNDRIRDEAARAVTAVSVRSWIDASTWCGSSMRTGR